MEVRVDCERELFDSEGLPAAWTSFNRSWLVRRGHLLHTTSEVSNCLLAVCAFRFSILAHFAQSYGNIYASGRNELLLSYVLMGRVYPVTEYAGPGFDDPANFYAKPLKDGYDSHYLLVHKLGIDGYPCPKDQSIDADEICVRSPCQVRLVSSVLLFFCQLR